MRRYEHSEVSEITSYEAADKRLRNKAGKPVLSRKVGNNTYLERHNVNGETVAIVVRLHATDVVRFFPNGRVALHTGGWYTVTTKDRINKWLPAPFSVYSKRGTWQVSLSWKTTKVHSDFVHETAGQIDGEDSKFTCEQYCYDHREIAENVPYFDGMILDPKTGTVVNGEKVPDEKARDKRNAKMRRDIKAYVALYTDERIKELITDANMASGDCFFCQLVRSNPTSKEISTDHYLSHFKEKYTMLSTLYAAASNRGNPWYVLQYAPDLARHDLSKMLRKALLEGVMVNR